MGTAFLNIYWYFHETINKICKPKWIMYTTVFNLYFVCIPSSLGAYGLSLFFFSDFDQIYIKIHNLSGLFFFFFFFFFFFYLRYILHKPCISFNGKRIHVKGRCLCQISFTFLLNGFCSKCKRFTLGSIFRYHSVVKYSHNTVHQPNVLTNLF